MNEARVTPVHALLRYRPASKYSSRAVTKPFLAAANYHAPKGRWQISLLERYLVQQIGQCRQKLLETTLDCGNSVRHVHNTGQGFNICKQSLNLANDTSDFVGNTSQGTLGVDVLDDGVDEINRDWNLSGDRREDPVVVSFDILEQVSDGGIQVVDGLWRSQISDKEAIRDSEDLR